MIPLHLGGLHPVEQWLVVAIAFGPFVVLGFVVYFVRRRDLREEHEAAAQVEKRLQSQERPLSPGR